MKDFILAVFSAFLGGTFVLLGQWYIFRRERYSNRRNVLYYLLAIYGNVKRLDRIKGVNKLFDTIFNKYNVENTEETQSFSNQLVLVIYEQIFTDVLDELDDLDTCYPDVVEELAKENPTLAVSINHYSRVLDKMVDYIGEATKRMKKEVSKNEHARVDQVMASILHNALIADSANELRHYILRISKSISMWETQRVNQVLTRMEKYEFTEEEINHMMVPVINSVRSATVEN